MQLLPEQGWNFFENSPISYWPSDQEGGGEEKGRRREGKGEEGREEGRESCVLGMWLSLQLGTCLYIDVSGRVILHCESLLYVYLCIPL